MVNSNRITLLCFLCAVIFGSHVHAQLQHTVNLPLRADGTIPAWLVAGPFEQSTRGFGEFADVDAVGEATVAAFENKSERSESVKGGRVQWALQSPDRKGYLALEETMGWAVPGRVPEKVWWSRAGYAFVQIESVVEQNALLLTGSNAQIRVYVNGTKLFQKNDQRGAVPDADTISCTLRRGSNSLLLKIGHTHLTHGLAFWGGSPWGWGSYARLVDAQRRPLQNVTARITVGSDQLSGKLIQTFFYKLMGGTLCQRFDLVFSSRVEEENTGRLVLQPQGHEIQVDLRDVRYGANRFPVYVPAPENPTPLTAVLHIGSQELRWQDTLVPAPRYELHMAMLTHTDIGYTHPQSVVKELHVSALDDALKLIDENPAFRWTLETTWQMREFEKIRPRERFDTLLAALKKGRMALSPVYSNPYTGWVGEETMIRSLDQAARYRRDYGITFDAAVYNDVPGLTWGIPRILRNAGVSFLMCGLNEVYDNYPLQQALPKAFRWEGADGARVVTYRTETYGESKEYGLEKDTIAIQHRMWERLLKLQAEGYSYPEVLLNSGWMDNGGVARHQFANAQEWNKQYAYPRFVFTTVPAFGQMFAQRHEAQLPILRGDWTSTWDIQFQGEPTAMIKIRQAENDVLSAEKLASIVWMKDHTQIPLTAQIRDVYHAILLFAGHGSGLEAGYGTKSDNTRTMEYRTQYVNDAVIGTRDAIDRAVWRLVRPEEDFQSPGLMVLNPLSWNRTMPLDVELKNEEPWQYEVVDCATHTIVPSHRHQDHLYVVAPDVPQMGFKKFTVRQLTTHEAEKRSGLTIGSASIENQFYRIGYDARAFRVQSIVRKSSGVELLDKKNQLGFNVPLRERPFGKEPLAPLPVDRGSVVVIDQRPVRVVLEILRPGNLVQSTRFTLWENIDRIDVAHAVNLEALVPPPSAEMYAVAFPVLDDSTSLMAEILGGFMNPEKDRLPGASREGLSIRRCLALSSAQGSVAIAAPDSRVFFWRKVGGRNVLLANLVNNFPTEWNRNEENKGVCELKFSLMARQGGFDAEGTSRLGWDVATAPLQRLTWIRLSPAESSYVQTNGRGVVLTAVKPANDGSGMIWRLTNVDPESGTTATVASSFLQGKRAFGATLTEAQGDEIPVINGAFTVTLRPNEWKTIRVKE
jgi:alpha-mannosidase